MIARARQFVRQRLGCHDAVCPGFLFVEETFGFFTVAPGEVGSFDECPHLVGIAVLGVAFAFLLAVG